MSEKQEASEQELLEALARLEHEQWCHWIKFQLDECAIDPETMTEEQCEEAGDKWDAWVDLSQKPYEKLTEEQKESDRVWARKVLEIIKKKGKVN